MTREREAHLFFESTTGTPYRGGAAFGNSCIERSLELNGYATRLFVSATPLGRKRSTPLAQAALAAEARALRSPALRVFSDHALGAVQPGAFAGGKNLVFLHGLKYNAPELLEAHGVAAYCTNSSYLRAVLLSLLLYPQAERGFAPLIHSEFVVGSAALCAPCTEYPDGYPTAEPSHRAQLRAQLRNTNKTWFAHAIRPGKANAFATLAILAHLNARLRSAGVQVKLFIYEGDFVRFARAASTLPARIDLEDVLIPTPFLSNTDLYWLMRRCKFCLCYDDYPEPFGIYPLDAVWNGTPVYTNGAGNLRHLLPQGHGIHAFETPAMWTGSPRRRFAAFGVAAERIACELSAGVPRSALRRWRNAISQRYGFDAFHMSLSGVVEYARTPAVLPPLELSELRIALSPLVRSWAGRGRVILSDYAHLELLPDATRVLSASLGRGVASLRREPEAVRETLQELFRLGVLALQPPPAAHVRLRGRQR